MNSELLFKTDPKGHFSEAIRTLRTNLQFSLSTNEANVFMVTSSIPSEGKSFISSNLSVAFAMNNFKVLLVDCDMRKGRLHKIFGVDNKKGLSNLLLEDVKNYKKYIVKTDVDNVSLLPLGIVPPNPSELLNSDKFKALIELLKSNYDLVILDTLFSIATITGISYSLIVAKCADEAVIVTSYKITPMDELSNTVKSLQTSGIKIAGIILNRMKHKKGSKYYYNKYYY